MIKKIRNSKASRIISFYLAIMLLLEILAPMQAYALTGGPTQPEFSSFTPIGTSDMVDLASGDFNYNIPIMDVGGYPINLAYNSGVSMDQEASWVGLGWDLNVGQINRQMRGIPDDFEGDEMIYENNIKENVSVGGNASVFYALMGQNEKKELIKTGQLSLGVGLEYNNYNGYNSSISAGLSYQLHNNVAVGLNLNSSIADGVSISPSVSLDFMTNREIENDRYLSANLGVSLNSRKGITSQTISVSANRMLKEYNNTYSTSIGTNLSYTDATYTPMKRAGMISSNYSFNLNIGAEIYGSEPGVKFTGYRVTQGIRNSEKFKAERAYGYENTYKATDYDVVDFNREDDRIFGTYSTTLPIVNHTFDIYSVQGQGVSGMFRPYKGQIGYVFDRHVNDESNGGSLGIETQPGSSMHIGVEGSIVSSNSSTKAWRETNYALFRFEEQRNGNRPDYEKVFFKSIGGFHVDEEIDLLRVRLGSYDPVKLDISGGTYSRSTTSLYKKKMNGPYNSYSDLPIYGPLKREKRLKRNQVIQKLTRKEVLKYGTKMPDSVRRLSPHTNKKHNHHTSEIRVVKEGGERYIYGRAAYNTKKKEVTFDVTDRLYDCKTGLVTYSPGDNTLFSNTSGDKYFNSITTPAYAHSYLLTAVLSSDYSDLTNDGPSDDDLGSYTRISYNDRITEKNPYKWRVPYAENKANFDEGLKTSTKDNKGNYIYGEKELLYIDSIITKTHVAIFEISSRRDGYGVKGENGGGSLSTSSKMYKLDKISLYSKAELESLGENAIPIKVAHFKYSYKLCSNPNSDTGLPNHFGGTAGQNGKLTLEKVYFTYRDSNMGIYTPYKFEYSDFNPVYDMKAYDTWGNYKPTSSGAGCGVNDIITNAEYPFVDQSDEAQLNNYASAWHLTSIELPSGGKIDVKYESDRYSFVQNREVMQMFKVVGVGSNIRPTSAQQLTNNILFSDTAEANNLYIKLSENIPADKIDDPEELLKFKDRYIRRLVNEDVYFRFLLNMAQPGSGHEDRYDYVTGYLKLKDLGYKLFNIGEESYASIPIKLVNKGDGINSSQQVNPIAKAGWLFGRQYLNRFVYTNPNDESTDDLEEIVMGIVGAFANLQSILKSPNKQLLDKGIASRFKIGKSWIRLMCPKPEKFGGGSRVKEIRMHDHWDKMTNHNDEREYQQSYGQQYLYEKGVAAYEPLGNKENPLIQPFYDYNYPEKLLGPSEENYVEYPFGECFYPSPKITYSKVTVQNLQRKTLTAEVKKHATGKVVTEFYTTYDYPTIVDFTDMAPKHDPPGTLSNLLNINVKEHITASQGYMIHTNDMDGKMKSQRIYGEGQTVAISGVDYFYDESEGQGTATYNQNQGKLNNEVTTIDSKGIVATKLVGVDYDVINDFRENRTVSTTGGAGVNTEVWQILLIPVPFWTPVPSYAYHESVMKSAVTTKVIHTSGILREKRVYDAGSSIATRNLAWDAETGEVLLTETVNEYNDKYYSFTFPAYWGYDGMGQAAKNIGLEWKLRRLNGTSQQFILDSPEFSAADFLAEGDELWIEPDILEVTQIETNLNPIKAYVVNINGNKFSLMREDGIYLQPNQLQDGTFKVIRSGFRNMSAASMASITSMLNPIGNSTGQLPNNLYNSSTWQQYRIVNTSAIEYRDVWAAQCECKLPKMQYANGNLFFNYENNSDNRRLAYNPYKYNVKGNWRPKVSYAYLTGRNASNSPNPRNNGFYNDFTPFYKYDVAQQKWLPNVNSPNFSKWTYASEVTQYNPYGFEIENKDALSRYSSALYGFNYRFPVAVASNSRYSEIAFDGFEDYEFNSCDTTSHLSFHKNLQPNRVHISSKHAHTGRKSLKVTPRDTATVKKRIIPCAN